MLKINEKNVTLTLFRIPYHIFVHNFSPRTHFTLKFGDKILLCMKVLTEWNPNRHGIISLRPWKAPKGPSLIGLNVKA